MQNIDQQVQKYKKTIAIGIFLILVFLVGNSNGFSKNQHVSETKVLGTTTHLVPTPTVTPVPTMQPITIINNIIIPTQAPIISPQVPSATPTQIPQATATPTPSPTPVVQPTDAVSPVPAFTPTLSPSPTPIPQSIEIDIDYAGAHPASTYTTTITANETAWQAVQNAIGGANVTYTDYGGSLGIFITGFNGIAAGSNQYYDFQVNGASSNVGVSSYIVANHDVLKFVLTNM